MRLTEERRKELVCEIEKQLAEDREMRNPATFIHAINGISAALDRIADSIRYLGDAVSEDEPLNFSLARGLDQISEAIKGTRED